MINEPFTNSLSKIDIGIEYYEMIIEGYKKALARIPNAEAVKKMFEEKEHAECLLKIFKVAKGK